jgi:low temperature requirement protein LtrA
MSFGLASQPTWQQILTAGRPCEDERVSTAAPSRRPHLTAVLREEERVTPLELFFDLVFVLALTQCTALMAKEPTWAGLAKGLIVLGILWWSWGGYVWLTSLVDPEEGAVRIVMFAAMAAFLVAALCVPDAYDHSAVVFVGSYAAVRILHLMLFMVGSRDEPELRKSVVALAASSAVGVGLLLAGALVGGDAQIAVWTVALVLDLAGPYFFGVEGWKIMPEHFAERYQLILIIALGESIVAIGVGAEGEVDAGVVAAAVIGTAVAAGLWWLYFDVVAIVASRRLARASPGREQNSMARDSYSYLHLPMVAGIVLLALGMKKTLAHVEDPLKLIPAIALLGGVALYLLAHVAFRMREIHTLNRQRLALAFVLLALIPLAVEVAALATVAAVAVLLSALIAYETHLYGERRNEVRHQLAREGAAQ